MKRSVKLLIPLFISAYLLITLMSHAHADAPYLSAASLFNCALNASNSLTCWGLNSDGQSTAPQGVFTQVSAGYLHACAVRNDSTAQCWGNNLRGQASAKSGNFVQVSAGGFHTCGLRPNNTIDCWGDNSFSQSRLQGGTYTQISAGFAHNCAVSTSGEMICWGANNKNQTQPPETSNGDYVAVDSGDLHTCGIHSDGTLSCWGWNDHGQATPPSGTFKDISAGWMHTCGLRSDNTVSCWGNNSEGQAKAPEGIFINISAGDNHSCGLRPNGKYQCWGLANAQDIRSPFSTNTFAEVTTGFMHTCGLKTDGTINCIGRNLFGESGAPKGTFSKVSAGDYHTCGIRTDGSVTCWGSQFIQQNTPSSGNFFDLDAGTTHNCALRNDGSAECWGDNRFGQSAPLGGTYSKISAGFLFSCGLRENGQINCWGSDIVGQSSPPGALAGAFTQISAGIFHACGTLNNGGLNCWGLNDFGQREPPAGNFKQVSAGSFHSCGVKTDGSLACWGGNQDGQADHPTDGTFSQVQVSDYHSCGLRTDGSITCWGFNPASVINPPQGLDGDTSSFTPAPPARTRLRNISTRGRTFGRGMEAGFIVQGQEQRFVIMGENLINMGNPVLRLYPFQAGIGKGPVLEENDNWRDHSTATDVVNEDREPRDELDAAFAVTLQQGAYIAELIDASGSGGEGVLSVTAVDENRFFETFPLNISTRGPSPMTAGFIAVGAESRCYVIKAEGPILNVGDASVSDPALVLRNFLTGEVVDANDNWQDHPSAAIIKDTFPPADPNEAALAIRLEEGVYLAELYSTRNSEEGQDSIVSVTELPGDKLQLFGCNTNKTPTVPPVVKDDPVNGNEPPQPFLETFISQPANNQQFDTGESITFKANAKIQPVAAPVDFNWNFGDNANTDSTTQAETTVRFSQAGFKTISLTVNGGNGLSETQQITVLIRNTEPPDTRK